MRFYHFLFIISSALLFAWIPVFAQPPTAEFTSNITSGCFPITVNFTDLSTNSPTSWSWDFGNSNTSTIQNPGAIYSAPGSYTVTLIVCNGNGCDTIVKDDYVMVFDYPVANFTANVTSGCAPLTVEFTDLSTPSSSSIVSWYWDFGDGNFSTTPNPVYTYPVPGIYDVSISITDSLGCNNSKSVTGFIIVSIPPALSFTQDSSISCIAPLTVTFTNNSTEGTYPVSSWFWEFGDGFTDTVLNPQHTYTGPGAYTVSLTATDSIGCAVTLTDPNAVVIGTDTADFTIMTLRTCSELQASFSGMSPGNISNWSWDLGDGSPLQSGQNITYDYTLSGQFTVTLVATNTAGCKDTVSKNISYLKVKAGFFPDTTYGCYLPFTVSFTDTSTGTLPISWQWDFSYEPQFGFNLQSTLQNPSYTYTFQDTFDVMLVVTDLYGCTDTVTLKANGDSIWLLRTNADFLRLPYEGCAPLVVNFTDISISNMEPIVSWQWNFDDPGSGANNFSSLQDPSHTFAFIGEYTVKLVITNNMGCSDSTTHLVRTGYPPVADSITKSKSIACHGEPVSFTAYSSDINVNGGLWDWGDGYSGSGWPSATHAFQDTGNLIIEFIPVYNGCEGTPIYDAIYILPPKPIFTPSSSFSCRAPLTVTFTNTSWDVDSWSWNFGDGSPVSTTWTPAHTYTSPGVYNVTLTVSNATTGCTDSENRTIRIPQPTAGFSASPTVGCVPLNVSFTDASFTYIPITYPITGWLWDFGDNTTSTLQNPNHTYTDTATFTVTLIITDAVGCKDTMVINDYISTSASAADFSGNPMIGCPPFTAGFTDQSFPYSPIVSWSWNFGDGSPVSSSQNPTHVYTVSGNFNVQLTITDSIGCTSSMSKPSYVIVTKPDAQFSHPPKICLNQVFIFNNNTSGPGLSYLWDFGDGDTSTADNPIHSYSVPGLHTVTMVATDTNNCTDTTTSQIEGIALPVPDFAVDSFFSMCPPLVVKFTDLSTNLNDSIVSWNWDFGDGTSASATNPVHTFVYPDTLSIQLTVTNSTGCVDSLLIPDMITVAGPTGSFSFAPDSGCVPMNVAFTSSANNTIQYTWDFGDGVIDTLSGPSVIHTYAQPGFFNPQLSLVDSTGCKVSAIPPSVSYLTIDEVVADFFMYPSPLFTPLCPPDTVFFSDSSYTLNDSTLITEWLWDFGDGVFDTLRDPIHSYTDTGIYSITLIATSSLGCSDSITQIISVILNDSLVLKAVITDSVPITCYGFDNGEATVSGLSGTPLYSYQWSATAGNQTTDSATGLPPGTHSVIVTDSMGCVDSTTVFIYEPAELNIITSGITGVSCNGYSDGSITVSVTGGTPSYSYQWDSAAGNQTTASAVNLMAGSYTLTVTDSNGCTATHTDTVSEPDTLVMYIIDTIPVACFGDSTGSSVVSASGGTQPYSYVWVPSFAGNSDTALNLPAQNYSVTVTDNNGCDTSLNLTITQPAELTVSITKSDVNCDGGNDGSATVTTTGGVMPYAYLWDDDSAQTTQTATALPAGIITVTVTDTNGCTIMTSDTITSPPPLILSMNNTDVSCYGGNDGSSTVTTTGGVMPYAYLWDDDSAQTAQTATALTAGILTVTVTDSNNCSAVDSVTVSEPDSLVISFNTENVSCSGENDGTATASVSGGAPPYDYLWNDTSAQTTSIATGLPSGTWEITVTDTNGCITSDTVTITEPTPIIISFITTVDVLCNGDSDGTATVNPAGGTLPYTYIWNDSLAQTTQTATALKAGTWEVTVTDTNNCTTDTLVTISEPPLLVAAIIEIISALCTGESDGELTADASGGTPDYSYWWLPVNSSGTSINGLTADDYILIVTDSNNCQASDTVAVIELTPLEVSVIDGGSDTVCFSTSYDLLAQTAGSAPPATFVWINGMDTLIGNPVTIVPDTTQSWYVMVIDSAGCTGDDSVTLYVNYLQVSLSFDDTVCYDTPTAIVAVASGTLPGYNSNYTYAWSTGQTTSSVELLLFSDTILSVSVTDGCSKPITDTVDIYLYLIPGIGIKTISTPVCPFYEITFSDTINDIPGSWHLWDFGDGNTQSGVTVQYAYSGGGNYYPSVTVTTPQGCSKTVQLSVPVPIYAFPNADFEAYPYTTQIIDPLIQFTDMSWIDPFLSDVIESYFWEFGDGYTASGTNTSHAYQDTGTFPVTLNLTTQYGCQGQITKEIRIDPYIDIRIPNTFTPDPYGSSSGRYDPESFDNDVFYPITKYVQVYLMQIFNRWGELIFESTDHAIGWDGYYRGKLSQVDTYIWKLKIVWTTGEEYNDVGRILLIR